MSIQFYGASMQVRRYITRSNVEAVNFASKYAGNVSTRNTPIGLVFEVWI